MHQLLWSLQRCLCSQFQTLLQIRVVSRVAMEIWGWGRSLGREGGEDACSSPARQEPGNSDPVQPQGFWEGGSHSLREQLPSWRSWHLRAKLK